MQSVQSLYQIYTFTPVMHHFGAYSTEIMGIFYVFAGTKIAVITYM